MPRFVGLGHYSRTGKDTLANSAIKRLGEIAPHLRVIKRPLAWKLKQTCFELYEWAGMREPEFYDTPEGEPYRDIILPALGKTPVGVWVSFGTNAVRDNVYQNTWLDYLLKADHQADIVFVPDIRFPNEFDAFYGLPDSWMLQSVRPGYGPRKTIADRKLLGEDRWHRVIGVTGTMTEIYTWAAYLAENLAFGTPLPEQTLAEKEAAWAVQKIDPWEQP